MLIRELIAGVLEFVAEFIGVHGLAIGLLAATVAGLWYLREAADAFVLLARYARVLSLIGFVVLALYVVGVVTGVVDAGTVGGLIAQIAN